jgi:hypothetical protein
MGGKWGGEIGRDEREGREGRERGGESERGGVRGECTEDDPAPSLSTSLLTGLIESLTLGSA